MTLPADTRAEVVYNPATGTILGIEYANQAMLQPGETQDALLTRCLALIAEHPSYVGMARLRVDHSALPDHVVADAQGDTCQIRNAWRVVGGVVVVDDTAVEVQTLQLAQRLRAVVPAEDWPAGVLADLDSAVKWKEQVPDDRTSKAPDVAMLQSIRARLLAATTGRVNADVVATFAAKRVPT